MLKLVVAVTVLEFSSGIGRPSDTMDRRTTLHSSKKPRNTELSDTWNCRGELYLFKDVPDAHNAADPQAYQVLGVELVVDYFCGKKQACFSARALTVFKILNRDSGNAISSLKHRHSGPSFSVSNMDICKEPLHCSQHSL